MKTMSKTTIRNATRQQLADYIATMTHDAPYGHEVTFSFLQKKARECERRSRGWFGETITFEEWAGN